MSQSPGDSHQAGLRDRPIGTLPSRGAEHPPARAIRYAQRIAEVTKLQAALEAYLLLRARIGNGLRVLSVGSAALAVNLIVGLALLIPEQSHEALRVLAENAEQGKAGLFVLWGLTTGLCLLSWWSVRRTLARLHPNARWWKGIGGLAATHVPRIIGVLPMGFLALAIWRTQTAEGPATSAWGLISIASAGIWLVARVVRIRRTGRKPAHDEAFGLLALLVGVALVLAQGLWLPTGLTALLGLSVLTGAALYMWWAFRSRNRRRDSSEPNLSPIAFWLAGVLPFLLALAWFFTMIWVPGVARYLGPASILVTAAIGWLPLLALLHWLSFELRAPLIFIPVAGGVCFSLANWNDNHAVRSIEAAPAGRNEARSTFEDWLRARPLATEWTHPLPVILVAAEGGGIYAAYYTALALANFEDAAPGFADQVFAISSVSGGSVGAAVFCGLVDHAKRSFPEGVAEPGWYAASTEKILGRDFLSPLIGAALLPDLLQRFLPIPFGAFDRARALEYSLEDAWRDAMGTDTLGAPFMALWSEGRFQVPSLILNTTQVEDGSRVVISNLQLPPAAFPNLTTLADLSPDLNPPLSTAAVLSARFPLVTPAGLVRSTATGTLPGARRLVDGGYFENTGVATLLDVLDEINRARDLDARTSQNPPPGYRALPPFQVIIVRIGATDSRSRVQFRGLGESLSPARAMLNARGARSRNAVRQLERLTEVYLEGQPLRATGLPGRIDRVLDTHRGYPIPLGWLLSNRARAEIKDQVLRAKGVPPGGATGASPPPAAIVPDPVQQVRDVVKQAK